jgi:hypothetical protein
MRGLPEQADVPSIRKPEKPKAASGFPGRPLLRYCAGKSFA